MIEIGKTLSIAHDYRTKVVLMNWPKRILIFLAMAAGAALLALGFRPSPILVDIEQVSRGRVEIAVEQEGRTRIRDRYVVSAPLPA